MQFDISKQRLPVDYKRGNKDRFFHTGMPPVENMMACIAHLLFKLMEAQRLYP